MSDGHGPGRQLETAICIPHEPRKGSPQQVCPDGHSVDARQLKPSTQEWLVSSHVPSSKHLENTAASAGQTSAPGHVHGSRLPGRGQGDGGCDIPGCPLSSSATGGSGSKLLQPAAAMNARTQDSRCELIANPSVSTAQPLLHKSGVSQGSLNADSALQCPHPKEELCETCCCWV